MKLIYAAALIGAFAFASCGNEDSNDENVGNGNGNSTEITDSNQNGGNDSEANATYHFDVWVSTDGTTGMQGHNDANARLVRSLSSLDDASMEINFDGVGSNLNTAGLNDEIMMHGKYYYQVAPMDNGEVGYGKYLINSQSITPVAERPFGTNTYASTKYCCDWVNDSTFIVIASAAGNSQVVWSKIVDKGNKLSIASEGTLDLSASGISQYSTSGLVRYRKSDNTLIYLFCDYSRAKTKTNKVFAAFINPETMAIRSIAEEARSSQLAGTVYGELAQQKLFFDEAGALYVACSSQIPGTGSTTCAYSSIYRINAGATEFDKTFERTVKPSGFTGDDNYFGSKIVTVDYLGNNKVLLYLQDPQYCGVTSTNEKYLGWDWTSCYNCYYAILNIGNGEMEPVKHGGNPLPFCKGTFSQRSVVLNGKAYIGTNPEQGNPTIYIYDIQTGNITKGASIKSGYEFNRITVMKD